MSYENMEQEISLKGIFLAVIRRWKGMLLWAVVLAIALGGLRGIMVWSRDSAPEYQQSQQDAYKVALADYELKLEYYYDQLEVLRSKIAVQQSYLSDSILMQLDHRNVPVATAGVYVSVDSGNAALAASIAEAYRMMLLSSDCMLPVAEELGIPEKYLWELITISGYDGKQNSPLLRVYVYGKDGQQAQMLMDRLLDQLTVCKQELNKTMVSHQVNAVPGGVNTIVSSDIEKYQQTEIDRLEDYRADMDYHQRSNMPYAPAAPEDPMKGTVKAAILFAILGGAAGVFLVAAAACVSYLLGDKVYSGEDIRSRYGIRLLGKVALSARNRNPIDRWLDMQENRPDYDDKPAFALMAAAVASYAGDALPVLITGSASDEKLQQFADLLRAEAPELPVIYCGGLLSSVEAVKRLPECGSVLLAECCGQSRYSKVAKQMDIAEGTGKQILGVVALEH